MKVAINGAGIAGPTPAYWLWRYGHEPLLTEQSSRLHTGGGTVRLVSWEGEVGQDRRS